VNARRSGRSVMVTCVLAAASLGPIACLDVSPVYLETSRDAGRDTLPSLDALEDADAAPVDARTACQDCIEYTGCAAKIAACDVYPVCHGTYACAIAKGCFRFADFKAIIDCGIGCAEAAGLHDQTSPEATAIIQVVVCAQERCIDACVEK
jgi:hypothetical protein